MNESILDKKIKTWEDQLLDLGKRNKMISFRESKRATLKILKPSFDELYQQIVVDEKELTFQRAIDRDSDVRVYSILALLDKLSCPMEVNIGDIRAEGSLSEIKKTLKHLRSKARLAMDEQGTNILYLVFGFIEWREKGARSNNWIKSPLILVPVTLTLPSLNAQYSMKKHEDEIVVNPTLAYLFERDYGITLPEFDSDKDTLDSYMQRMETLVDERGWRITRECSIGLVSFLKISMYNDLIENETQLKENPIIRAFAGERNTVNTLNDKSYEFDHDACRSVDSFQVLNADSSQQDAIALSQKGVSFVMQGPPGTGKSQTITNIIAQALADGKKILFVSEKMAALDVVYRRLQDVHLSDFCLSLHSHKANKKEILDQLGSNLSLTRIKVKDEEIAKLTRLDMIRKQLKAYVHDIHRTIMPLEMSLYEVYGAILELGTLPDIEIHLADADKLTKDDVNRLALLVMNFDKAQGELGPQWYKNPWQGILCSYLEVSQKRELQNKILDAVRILSPLEECKLHEKTLADILTVDTLDDFWSLYDHARHCSLIPNDWFYRSIEQEECLVRMLCDKKHTIDDLTKTLASKNNHEFFNLDGQKLYTQFVSAIRDYCAILRNAETEDKAFKHIEYDLQQAKILNETCQLLVDALNVFFEKYNLKLPCDYNSVETVLTICEMLFEKRKLTSWYFGKESNNQLNQYATELEHKISEYVVQKQRLCERYSHDIFEYDTADQLLHKFNTAANILKTLLTAVNLDYAVLGSIASFDLGALKEIEDALNHNSFAIMANTCEIQLPSTFSEVKAQISALENVRHNIVVPSWKSLSARNKAKQLLSNVIIRTNKLADDKKELKEFFEKYGIVLEIDTLSESDVTKLQCASEVIPEAATIVSSSKSDEAYRLLDTIDQKASRYVSLAQEINNHRTEYHIIDTIDNFELLSALRECSDAVRMSTPCSAWATSKTDAISLLEQLKTIANSLKTQHKQLLTTYEESVFALDYIGILNRFKADYTSFFKIFKSSYREDVKQIRLAFKEVRKKISDDEIIVLLQTLRKYNEELERYRSFAEQAAKLFEVQEYDIWYDWDAVKKRLDAFETVRHIFQDDAATYRFIVDDLWNCIFDSLVCYDEINTWFVGNDAANKLYANLYIGAKTDTERIRNVLIHARTMCQLFISPDHYLQYMLSGTESICAQKATNCATAIIDARNWFVAQSNEIEEYTGIVYDEKCNLWKDTLSHLETFESIIEVVGESAGYSLVKKYHSDNAVIDSYLEALLRVSKIAECAKAVYHISSDSSDIGAVDVRSLVSDIHTISVNATDLLSVYSILSDYCPDGYSLNINEIEIDLNAIVLCQNTHNYLTEIETDARTKIGEEYIGFTTNWASVHSNIDFCNKVMHMMPGEISSELEADFVNATALYSKSQLSELWQHLTKARKIQEEYPTLNEYKDINSKIQVLSKTIASLESAISIKNTVAATAYTECNYFSITEALNTLAQVKETQVAFNGDLTKAKIILPMFAFDSNTDWNYIVEIFNHIRQVKRIINSNRIDVEITQLVTNSISGITVSSYYDQIEKLMRNINIITDITSLFSSKTTLEAYSLSKLTRRLRNCNEQFATMDAWIDLRDCRKACVDNGLEDFIATAENTYYSAGMLKDIFLKSFYYEWFEKISAGIKSVSTFRVRTQSSRIETFRELDSHQLPVDQMRIRERLIREMPNKHNFGRATDEMSILLHELNKKRNIMPLRKLFRTIPNLLLKLKPCLMMSPLSVAYFLEAETYKFDIVIFDEASQIFPQDAIGAIFRAKQVIIAGDSKQLPPTNFFAASTSNDDEFDSDDDYEEVNFDSILEEASNSLPNRSLLWHYRSRFEELISFSNQQIYQNNLITFPSSTIHEADTGVEYVYVKDGVYENRCNRAEAQQIVCMVEDHIKKYPGRSLGVIAFSESQQSVIEDEINKFRMQNPNNEIFFDEDKDEPFFVKNLENVQGDERDTIIFSICYAKNAQGRMYMRFGPLGHQGGERRLNVAITRAKHNVKLVGSILPEDIDLSKTHSDGVRMLRSYISFAMHGGAALDKCEKKNSLYNVDTFSEQVGKFLISRGCTIQMNVGSSDYTIDIAVEHPNKPGHYIAGIECDGNSYFIAKTVRDREHLRTTVLEQMGWKMYRVWSTEWIRNPEAEQERLMSFIRDALVHYGEIAKQIPAPNKTNNHVETETVRAKSTSSKVNPDNPYGFSLYVEGKWDKVNRYRARDNLSMLADRIHAVVKVEQPIHLDILYRRLADAFGMVKASQGVRDTINEAIQKRMVGEVTIKDQFVQLCDFTTVKVRRSPLGSPDRNIEYIAIPEIAAAMEKILIGAYGMERSILCSEAAKVFGFERTGAKIKQRTNEAVDYLVRNKKISDYDGKIQLLED